MRKGGHLKVISFGTDMMGVRLLGDPRQPEPSEFRIAFPGGDVVITRTTDNQYWAHLNVHHCDITSEDLGEIVDLRVDSGGTNAKGHRRITHVAARIMAHPKESGEEKTARIHAHQRAANEGRQG